MGLPIGCLNGDRGRYTAAIHQNQPEMKSMRRSTLHISSLALAMTAGLLIGCEQQPAEDTNDDAATASTSTSEVVPAASTTADGVAVNFSVKGMHCGGCAAGVKQTLVKMDGVLEADVSFDDSKAVVKLKDASMTDDILKAIRDLGYEASLASTEDAAPAGADDAAEA